MITLDEIHKKAFRRYEDYLRSLVNGKSFFPLIIPADKKLDKGGGVSNIIEQLNPIYRRSKEAIGFGYSLQTVTTNGKMGPITTIKKLWFSSEEDYLKYLEKEAEVKLFKEQLAVVLSEYPILKELFSQSPTLIIDYLNQWDSLIKVCRYFEINTHKGLYIRELPVAVHTKFVERNKDVVLRLLSTIAPHLINPEGDTFQEKLGLREKHNLIRIRFLDDNLQVLAGFKEIGITETEINLLNIPCKRVFIIENDIAALTFPQVENAIVLFGKGFNVASLKHVQWLNEKDIYYWGDLDVHGFEILSQIRSYFAHTKSLLMDIDTVKLFQYEKWHENSTKYRNELERLYENEKAAYNYITDRDAPIRLEQEQIPLSIVRESLSMIS